LSRDLAPKPGPRVAVVIPCYNSQAWVGRALHSVLDQNYPEIVPIVIDDGSTDDSLDVLRSFGDRVMVETGPNRGACHARNRGLALATEAGASHIVFLDADDYFEGPVIRGAVEAALREQADLVLSEMVWEDEAGKRRERRLYSGVVSPETVFAGWMRKDYFIPGCLLWRRTLVESLGGWDESLSRYQDTDIALRAMFAGPRIVKNDQGRVVYSTINPGSIARTPSRAATESQIRVLVSLLDRVAGTPFAPSAPLLHEKLYDTARLAFRRKHTDLGRLALREVRKRGFRGHPGNLPHKILASLIGLEAKVQLRGR
jgi:glycosyltransferase involved in cell wall biosynthesis